MRYLPPVLRPPVLRPPVRWPPVLWPPVLRPSALGQCVGTSGLAASALVASALAASVPAAHVSANVQALQLGGPVLKLAKKFGPNAIFRVASCLYILYDLTCSSWWQNPTHSLSYEA